MSSSNARAGNGTMTVCLLADPGLPMRVVTRLTTDLPDALARRVSDRVSWEVRVVHGPLLLDEQGRVPVLDLASGPDEDFDVMFCLTDLPRRQGPQPMVAEVSVRHGVALVSLPGLGGIRVHGRTRELLVFLVHRMLGSQLQLTQEARRRRSPIRRWLAELGAPVRYVPVADRAMDIRLAAVGLRGRTRLLAGMVRDNRPWRLVPSLTDAIGAAVAGSSFGLFFSTIWKLADALHLARLVGITVLALAVLVGWLIIDNDLWEHPLSRREDLTLYNVATLLTLVLGASFMYALLFAVMLTGSGIVIPADYLQSTLGHPIGVGDYATLAWLSSSMGTVAGALGAGLESEQAVREATFSKREQQRRNARREGEERRAAGEET